MVDYEDTHPYVRKRKPVPILLLLLITINIYRLMYQIVLYLPYICFFSIQLINPKTKRNRSDSEIPRSERIGLAGYASEEDTIAGFSDYEGDQAETTNSKVMQQVMDEVIHIHSYSISPYNG